MKKLAALIITACLATVAFGQSKTVEAFQNKYKDDRDAKVVSLNGSLFELIAKIGSFDEEDEDLQVMSRIAENIKSMNVLSIPLYKSGFTREDVEKMRKNLKGEHYEELMTVRDGADKIYFMTQGNKDQIKNMLVLVQEEEDFVLLNIDGSLQMEDLAYLAKNRKRWN